MKVLEASNSTFAEKWEVLWQEQPFQHPRAADWGVPYYVEYFKGGRTFDDISFIVDSEDGPVLGLRIHIEKGGSEIRFSNAARSLVYLESRKRVEQAPSAFALFKEHFLKITKDFPSAEISYLDYLEDGSISRFALFLLENGALSTPYLTQMIDLSDDEKTLWSATRKSYRSLINWGIKSLDLEILDSKTVEPKHVELLRTLHVGAAGRETRSQKSWEMQYDWIKSGNAFLILGYLEGRCVTGILTLVTPQCAFYGVGAVDRLSDEPLSHAPLWQAILHSKAIGCKWFEVGAQVFTVQQEKQINSQLRQSEEKSSNLEISEKQKNMSLFKRGFGGATRCWLQLAALVSENTVK